MGFLGYSKLIEIRSYSYFRNIFGLIPTSQVFELIPTYRLFNLIPTSEIFSDLFLLHKYSNLFLLKIRTYSGAPSIVVMTRQTSKIAAVPTAFSFGGTINPPTTKYSASKGTCCRHSFNLGFLTSLIRTNSQIG